MATPGLEIEAGAPRRLPGEGEGLWARVIWLDRQIREGRYPNAAALAAEFGCSRRTAFNTLDFLRYSAGAPVAYDRRRAGYHYADPTYALPAVLLAEGELLALALAEQAARQYLGTPLEAPLREVVRKLSRYLPEAVRVDLEAVAEVFRFAGGGGIEVPLARLSDVQRAVRERRVVRMLYHSASRDEICERDVEPHFLRNVRGDWMFAGWDRLRDGPRVFMVARVLEHEVLGQRFAPRAELRPDVFDRHTFLTERGGEPFEVVLRFDAYQARWIRERQWHASQRIEELPEGGLLLRLTVGGEGDLLRWVLGYGEHVEVLEPEWLRERVAERLRQAVGLYWRRSEESEGAEWTRM